MPPNFAVEVLSAKVCVGLLLPGARREDNKLGEQVAILFFSGKQQPQIKLVLRWYTSLGISRRSNRHH
jgi:hypothetical protein